MLHHISVGVTDVSEACRFYDPVLGALGYRRVMEFLPHAVAYGDSAPQFWVQLPHDGQRASSGNGTHIGFAAGSQRTVQAFHAAAVKAGAQDEGAPGPRPDYHPNYYGAFVRDPFGNKIEAVFFAMEPAKAPTKAKAKRKAKPARKGAAKKSLARKSPGRRPDKGRTRKR
jgi:catechol 2,3-dioxygenase-like lactoylglutathione lyase family enzyme